MASVVRPLERNSSSRAFTSLTGSAELWSRNSSMPGGVEDLHVGVGAEVVVHLVLQRIGFEAEDVQCSWHRRSEGGIRVGSRAAAKPLHFMTRLES